MSTLTTIAGGDGVSPSRTVINSNFNALNTDKIETSVLDIDTALTANSDLKVATQKAVKAYVDASPLGNASTSARGVVQEATQAQVSAGTGTGGTGARLFVNPSTLYPAAATVIPQPPGQVVSGGAGAPTDTAALVAYFYVPAAITVNKVSIRTLTNVSTSAIDMSLYSSDGATRLFAVSSAISLAASSVVTTAVSGVYLSPGYYWFLVNTDTATLMQVAIYDNAVVPFSTTAGLLGDVSSEPVLSGTITITSGTPPATLTISSITDAALTAVAFRLDN